MAMWIKYENYLFEWVSEWVIVQCQVSNFSAISWQEQVAFWWEDVHIFILDQHGELDFYSAILLKQQSVGRHVAPLWHIIYWFLANQSLPLLFNVAYLAEK